jgi:hypothetical protein
MLANHRAERDRRSRPDRRERVWWSLLYGNFNPRRRTPSRREFESRFHSLDWHAAHLLAVTLGILLLSVADALMTVRLLSGGADELNPVMEAVIGRSTTAFVGVKMTLTGVGVTIMVILARYRFMRVVRVDLALYAVLMGYIGLLAYEFSLFRTLSDAFAL